MRYDVACDSLRGKGYFGKSTCRDSTVSLIPFVQPVLVFWRRRFARWLSSFPKGIALASLWMRSQPPDLVMNTKAGYCRWSFSLECQHSSRAPGKVNVFLFDKILRMFSWFALNSWLMQSLRLLIPLPGANAPVFTEAPPSRRLECLSGGS